MKRILIAGASTFGVKNQGDDAMFCNLVEGFRRHLPDCQLTFLARHPNEQFDKAFGVHSIKNFEHENKAQSLDRWFWGFNPGDPGDHLAKGAFINAGKILPAGTENTAVSLQNFIHI